MARRSYVGRPPAPAIPRAPSRMCILSHEHSLVVLHLTLRITATYWGKIVRYRFNSEGVR